MKTLVLLLLALSSPLAHSAYTPPVQRYDATFFEGHSGEKDETARSCNLDIALIRPALGEPFWVMLVLFSDPISHMTFRPLIPTAILPLKEGATWTDYLGRSYSYKNGVLASDDDEIRYKIDNRFLFPESAEGKTAGKNGLSGSHLHCEF
jgi:hypothetical protein